MSGPQNSEYLQLVVSLANAGRLDEAEVQARNIRDKVISAGAWRLLSLANANSQRLERARHAIEMALGSCPGTPELRFERALILELQGESAAALAEFEDLARDPQAPPRLLVHLGRALEF